MGLAVLIALVVGKEGINALLAQIGWPKLSIRRANGRIRELITLLVSIVAMTTLNVAHEQITVRFMVGEVRERFKTLNIFAYHSVLVFVGDPSRIGRVLRVESNQWLDQVLDTTSRKHNASFGDEDFAPLMAKSIPLFSVVDRFVDDIKIV